MQNEANANLSAVRVDLGVSPSPEMSHYLGVPLSRFAGGGRESLGSRAGLAAALFLLDLGDDLGQWPADFLRALAGEVLVDAGGQMFPRLRAERVAEQAEEMRWGGQRQVVELSAVAALL